MLDLFLEHLNRNYNNHKILILGFGREGQSTLYMLRQAFPTLDIFVSDQNPLQLGKVNDRHLLSHIKYLEDLEQYDVIFKTPGISLWENGLQKYVQGGGRITSQLNEFLDVFHHQTIGITGTKGKSTTSALVYHLLKTANLPTLFTGNIGIPVFESIQEIQPKTQVVVEMSSYQLELITQSPHIAVLLDIFPEHLNHHRSFENYLAAKARITQFQNKDDVLIYNKDFPELQWLASRSQANKVPFSLGELPAELKPDTYPNLNQVIRTKILLPAFLIGQTLGLSTDQMQKAFETFAALPHRLENIGTYNDVTFIDDTLATIPEAASVAIDALPRVDVIILGGFDRGLQYEPIAKKVIEKRIPTILLFRPSGEKIAEHFHQLKPASYMPNMQFVENMEEAVRLSYQHAPKGGVVLLSPASPSFGQFRDYEDKAQQFDVWV